MSTTTFTKGQCVAALQTAASLETIAHSGYLSALPLKQVRRAPQLVRQFNESAATHHFAHLQAINDALDALGADPQYHPDMPVADALTPLLARVPQGGLPAVLRAALYVEERLFATHTAYSMRAADSKLRALFGSIAGVEAQHVAVLRQSQVLVESGHEAQIQLPPPHLVAIPPAAGTQPIPEAFAPTTLARPYAEGAVGG
jgi:hypothetical protein